MLNRFGITILTKIDENNHTLRKITADYDNSRLHFIICLRCFLCGLLGHIFVGKPGESPVGKIPISGLKIVQLILQKCVVGMIQKNT